MYRREMLQALSAAICGFLGMRQGDAQVCELPDDRPGTPLVVNCERRLTQEQRALIHKHLASKVDRDCIVLDKGMTLSEFTPYSVTEVFGDYSRTTTFATNKELQDHLHKKWIGRPGS